jgi:hypothetical protein
MRYPAGNKAEERDGADRERRSRSTVALMLGAVSISRARSDAATHGKVLGAEREPAFRLISPGKQPK